MLASRDFADFLDILKALERSPVFSLNDALLSLPLLSGGSELICFITSSLSSSSSSA
jgi:hypothetical protein